MSFDAVALAEELNRSCHCISVDAAKLRQCLESGPITAGLYASIAHNQPNLFSSSSVFLAPRASRAHASGDRGRRVGRALDRLLHLGERLAPPHARSDHGPQGVFLGYDFHLGREGPQLIEINTNAGGALLNAALARAQQACCVEVEAAVRGAHDVAGLESVFVAMFREEWRRQRGATPLHHVVIVDEQPAAQYLYPEFLLFQQVFRHAGLEASIVDPRSLVHVRGGLLAEGNPVDLVYNRLTDFWLAGEACRALRAAYDAGDAVVTPNPHVYALYADKRHLVVLSDADRLRDWGIAADAIELLAASVPRTRLVEAGEGEALWRARKQLFFKPVDGYGGKAAYRGDKLTRATWEQILSRPYVAQRLVAPSQRTIAIDGRDVPLKLDVRNYVYGGAVQLVAARLYQGQTTNFRTTGGGFAPVFTETAAT